mmetsp:Transcript_42052/g.108932  ORF Transcript_42052/g.108932 Transcript_42052/m.108932 type:complete len:100 (+) Transcript_42052:30-329(+)
MWAPRRHAGRALRREPFTCLRVVETYAVHADLLESMDRPQAGLLEPDRRLCDPWLLPKPKRSVDIVRTEFSVVSAFADGRAGTVGANLLGRDDDRNQDW